jgi:hypothetical protein
MLTPNLRPHFYNHPCFGIIILAAGRSIQSAQADIMSIQYRGGASFAFGHLALQQAATRLDYVISHLTIYYESLSPSRHSHLAPHPTLYSKPTVQYTRPIPSTPCVQRKTGTLHSHSALAPIAFQYDQPVTSWTGLAIKASSHSPSFIDGYKSSDLSIS